MNENLNEYNYSFDIIQKNIKILPKINTNYSTLLNRNRNSIRLIKKKQPYKNSILKKNLSYSNISYNNNNKTIELFPSKFNNDNKKSNSNLNINNKNFFVTNNINKKNNKQIKVSKSSENILIDEYNNYNLGPIWEKLSNYNKIINKNQNLNSKKKLLNISDYLNRSRKMNLLNYRNNLNKERYKRLIMNKKNELNKISETFNELKKQENNINNFFDNNLKYIKYLKNKVDFEEENKLQLLIKIRKLKNDILSIQNKIEYLESKKNKLFKWFSFQIQVHERLAIFPENYRKILYYEKATIDNENLIKEKLNGYKNKIIYKTIDDINNEFIKIGKSSFNDLNIYSKKSKEVEKLKRELKEYENNDFIKHVEEDLKIKENILNNCKNKFVKLIYERVNLIEQDKLKYNNNFYKKNKIKFSIDNLKTLNNLKLTKIKKIAIISKKGIFQSLSQQNINKKNEKKNSKLYEKVSNIFQFCLKANNFISFNYIFNKTNDTYETKILIMLEYIENTFLKFLKEKQYFNNDEKLKIIYNKIKIKYEKDNKHLKNEMNKKLINLRYKEKLQQLQNKYEKIYFLENRKIKPVKYCFINKKQNNSQTQNENIIKNELDNFL